MKVVLFCGGLGMRLREYSEQVPKPMVPVGYRPILWHLMKYYAHFGHKDFILCLGHRGDVIKSYFLKYEEHLTNDFVLTKGGRQVDLLSSDIDDWRITFVDTGPLTTIGGRLLAVREYLRGEELFLANYTDNLCDLDLNCMQAQFENRGAVAGFVCVRPNVSFHLVKTDDGNMVSEITSARRSDVWSNGGYFMLRQDIFCYVKPGEELVEQPFQRLIERRGLYAHKYEGFWACMDTFKERQELETLYQGGRPPWEVWKKRDESS